MLIMYSDILLSMKIFVSVLIYNMSGIGILYRVVDIYILMIVLLDYMTS